MATKLLATLTFTNVAGGAIVSQAHGLNSQGVALLPDLIYPSTTGQFTISADATNVTVENLADTPSTITVLAEYRHSAGRVTDGALNTPLVVQSSTQLGYGSSVARYTYVNPTTGSDVVGTGTALFPYATINYALSKLGRVLIGPHVIILTGTALHREQVVIPSFESSDDVTYDLNGPLPHTLYEYPVTIAADLTYGTRTPLTVVSATPDSPTELYQLVVTGVNVNADDLVGRCVIGAGVLEVAWIGRNTATVGGQTTLNLSTPNELTEPVYLATPIELKAPDGTTDATVLARGVRGSFSLQGLKISHPGASTGRSLDFTDVLGDVHLVGCDVSAGLIFYNVSSPQLTACRVGSQVALGVSTNASRSTVNIGLGASYDYCLFQNAHLLNVAPAAADAYGWCYFRQCNDIGHGGGAYVTAGVFDLYGCWIDQQSGQGSNSGVNYAGGPRCSLENTRIENCGNGINVADCGGGLRAKNVVGTNTGVGIRVGDRTSPFLGGGGGSVRISSTTSVTGGLGNTWIGELGYRSYTAIRAAYGKILQDPYTGAKIWES